MLENDMKSMSYWLDSAILPKFPSLLRDLHVDVVVVGGGITGITAAYLFKKSGHKVALVERQRCGRVDSGQTTAHLTCVTDRRLHELVSDFGKESAKAVWEAGFAAIDQIAAIIRNEKLKCDLKWVPGYLHASLKGDAKKEREGLEKDAQLAQELGFEAEFLDSIPYFKQPGVRFSNQAKFHPLKYLSALARMIPGKGSYLFENAAAETFEEKPLTVHAGSHKIRCDYIFLATHTPLMGTTGLVSATLFQTKLSLYTSYVLGASLPRGLLPEASFWDTGNPYYYLRVDRRRGFDFAILGGEDHKTGQESDTELPYRRLKQMLREILPSAEVTHRWSGQVIETNDGLPFIGETAKQQFTATGFAGNGFTFGTFGAMMAVDAFLGKKNPWSELFDVSRKKLKGGMWDYLKENKDYPYYLLRDWLGRADGTSLKQLRKGQGKILNLAGKKVAAYRNQNGKVSLRSPVCTHLKCIVGWNKAEKTWDCPCHGSRFKATGEVLTGPAEEDLEEIPLPKQ
jgi:glycine/D-amino acid oxidase-like deaminating enzyme/nitrite reductase/ring-hydroxylating ferredoxin subunit